MGADYRKSSYSIFAGTVSGAQAANTQAAYSPNGDVAAAWGNNLFVAIPICRAGTLQHLYYETFGPPGAGETFTLTVWVNGIVTLLSVQIAGAVQIAGNDVVNQIPVVPGDNILMEIVTSLNAGITWHKWSFELV